MNMQMLFDASEYLLYFPEKMDTGKALWLVRDVLDVDAVRENAAALTLEGDILDGLRASKPFLTAFPAVFVALADETLAADVAAMLSECVLGLPVLTPRKGAFGSCANVREVLETGGRQAVDRIMQGAIEHPAYGLLNIADIQCEDESRQPSVLSGICELDSATGGFYAGELSVWTGKRGSGKSTFLGQILLDAIDQGHRVCVYSGELSVWRFKLWALQQAAGTEYIETVRDSFTGKTFYRVPQQVRRQIDDWWRGRLFLYDNSAGSDEDSILSLFELAVRRYGCGVFMVDNLMSTRLSTSREADFYRAQSSFTGRLVEFAKKHDVHVHLVAHPRKTDGARLLDADEVGGSGDITNRADNVFSLQRLSDEDAAKQGYQTVLRVLKNRAYGATIGISLNYDEASRRFHRAGTRSKRCGWDTGGIQNAIPLPERKDGGPF